MNFLKTSVAALLATSILTASAMASDVFDGKYEDNEADPQVHTYFQGIAVGIDGGGQFTSIQLNDPYGSFEFDGISADGLTGGAHLEYLLAFDRLRFGAYGEGGFSNVNTTAKIGSFDGDVLTMDHYYGAGLKVGTTVYDNTLLFARAGYDWSQWSSDLGTGTGDVGSWLIGGGIETMISENLSLGLGADYLLVNDVEAASTDLSDLFSDSEMLRVKARLTWRQ